MLVAASEGLLHVSSCSSERSWHQVVAVHASMTMMTMTPQLLLFQLPTTWVAMLGLLLLRRWLILLLMGFGQHAHLCQDEAMQMMPCVKLCPLSWRTPAAHPAQAYVEGVRVHLCS